MSTTYFYLKFCRYRQHAEDFFDGRLYLNRVDFFEKCESSDDGREDPHEGASHWHQPKDLSVIEIGGICIPSSELAGAVIIRPKAPLGQHLLCLYAGSSGPFDTICPQNVAAFREYMAVPKECSRMGSFVVVVRDVPTFDQRFDDAIRREGFALERGPVRYFDPSTWSGRFDRPLFWKQSDFAWQREYRFLVDRGVEAPDALILRVGDLRDICTLAETTDVNSLLSFTVPAEEEARPV